MSDRDVSQLPYVSQDVLYTIQRADPDGGEREPTAADYAAFEAWARQGFGDAAWEVYSAGGWAQDRSEGDWSHFSPHFDYDEY